MIKNDDQIFASANKNPLPAPGINKDKNRREGSVEGKLRRTLLDSFDDSPHNKNPINSQ